MKRPQMIRMMNIEYIPESSSPLCIVNQHKMKQTRNCKKEVKRKTKNDIQKQLFPDYDEKQDIDNAGTSSSVDPLAENLDVESGMYVLVKFNVRDKTQFYAGLIVTKKGDGVLVVKFLRRMPVKHLSTVEMLFQYPEEEDARDINTQDVVLVVH